MGIESFRYDGKRALVVGGATGMGAAAAEIVRDLGAEVVVMDYADVSFPVRQGDQGRPPQPPKTSTRPSTRSAVRCTRCSRARASPTAPRAS